MSLNRCDFIGNLGADPEVRRTQSGDPIVNMRLAVTEKWRGSDGERKERTEWIPVVIFSAGLAKVAEQYLQKGSKVFVSGSWRTRKWQDQSGQDRYSTEVVLQGFNATLVMLDGNRGDDKPAPEQKRQSMYDREVKGGSYASDLDDEIPFAPEWR